LKGPLPWLIDLSEFLHCQEYAATETNAILISVLDHGTLQVAVDRQHLDPEDYAAAEQIYTDSQPAVPQHDPAWDDPDLWELGPAIPPGTVLIPPELDDDDAEDDVKPDWKNWAASVNCQNIKPVSGGAPVSLLENTVATIDRCADMAEKIVRLQAELSAVPADWASNYYPFMGR
jgi:hypothetical protein